MLQRTGVLFLTWWVLCSLLLAGTAVAQTEGELPGPGPTEGCANPQQRAQLSGTENRRTNPFPINGDVLRIRFSTEATDPDSIDDNLIVTVLRANGDRVDSVLVLEPSSGSENVLLDSPGAHAIEIEAGDVRYELAVDDCGTVDAGGPDDGDGNGPDDDQYGNPPDGQPDDDQYGNPPDDQPGDKPGDVDDPDDVILDPILEDKKLVNTGGIPLVAVAGLLLACSTGLLVRVLRG